MKFDRVSRGGWSVKRARIYIAKYLITVSGIRGNCVEAIWVCFYDAPFFDLCYVGYRNLPSLVIPQCNKRIFGGFSGPAVGVGKGIGSRNADAVLSKGTKTVSCDEY